MELNGWYKQRGFRFVCQRGFQLLDRYSVGPNKGTHRIKDSVEALAELGCLPTYFTPGIIVKRYPQFIQHLQQMGAEIAVHSYDHIYLNQLPIPVAQKQLFRAINTFERFGIEVRGFRCPYLSYSNELLNSLPKGMFDYSSNEAILWDAVGHLDLSRRGLFFNTLEKFYHSRNSTEYVCLPSTRTNMLEIPVCVPDDLQLHDGLLLNDEGIIKAWSQFLEHNYIRGELFNLIFHTELASYYDNPFVELIRRAKQYMPIVWIARLRDISDWWREKSKFTVEVVSTQKSLKLFFDCSARATILIRGLDLPGSGLIWDSMYSRLQSNTLEVLANPRPFIGLASDVPKTAILFLSEQGYILDTGETAVQCGIYLSASDLSKFGDNVQLINYIETSASPLVRYWRWPNGAKSALSITGDLDALSLQDYVSRLFIT